MVIYVYSSLKVLCELVKCANAGTIWLLVKDLYEMFD